MPSKTRRVAVDAVRERLAAIAGCVTDRPVVVGGSLAPAHPPEFSFRPLGLPTRLRGRLQDRGLHFHMAIGFLIGQYENGYIARQVDYQHYLLDADQREILAYHWHPTGVSPVTWPHLHLSGRLAPLDAGRGQALITIGGMHLPTGHVTLADVVRLLITEFDIRPRRADWAGVLETNHDPFAPED
jgi:hypothetical protein